MMSRHSHRWLPVLNAGPDAAGGTIRLDLSEDGGFTLRPAADLELLASTIGQGTAPEAARTAAQIREVASWRHCPWDVQPKGFRQEFDRERRKRGSGSRGA